MVLRICRNLLLTGKRRIAALEARKRQEESWQTDISFSQGPHMRCGTMHHSEHVSAFNSAHCFLSRRVPTTNLPATTPALFLAQCNPLGRAQRGRASDTAQRSIDFAATGGRGAESSNS